MKVTRKALTDQLHGGDIENWVTPLPPNGVKLSESKCT
jgi:hypothetical protein